MASNDETTIITYGDIQDIVAQRIREMILNGQLIPGDRLQQDELANTFGVSTMPVREALRRLQAEGLVYFRPRRGATVALISLSEYEEIFRIREALEIMACRWAAEDFRRIPVDQLGKILADLEATEGQMDVPRRLQLVREFFFTIFEASEKEHLLRLLSSLWDLSQQYRRYFSMVPDAAPTRLEHYRNIFRACETQDQEALVRSLQELYAFVRRMIIPLLRENEGTEGQTL